MLDTCMHGTDVQLTTVTIQTTMSYIVAQWSGTCRTTDHIAITDDIVDKLSMPHTFLGVSGVIVIG